MSAPSPVLSILVLTEDSAEDGRATVLALVKKMLGVIEPGYGSHRIEWAPATPKAQQAMRGNAWKGKDHRKAVDLFQSIATKLAERDPPGMVLFHIDGDRSWTGRESSENVAKFQAKVPVGVRQLVRAALEKKGRLEEEEERMGRLLPLVPYYSIEAWLLQNTVEGRRLCLNNRCSEHLEAFNTWAADRSLLDDVLEPKDATCLGDRHNLELAGAGFPAEPVYDAGRSFTAAVNALCECNVLCECLKDTRPS